MAVPRSYSDLMVSLLQVEAAEMRGTAQLVQQLLYYWLWLGVLGGAVV